MNFSKYFKNYNKTIYELLNNVDDKLISQSASLIKKSIKNSGRIYIVGNGGSSSIASHVSVDFAKVANVPSSTFNNANLITCFANDFPRIGLRIRLLFVGWMQILLCFYIISLTRSSLPWL